MQQAIKNINIITFGSFNENLLEELSIKAGSEFGTGVSFQDGKIEISDFYDPVRRQYDGNRLLAAIDSLHNNEAIKIIGLFQVDLFIPILTYIFGQAFLNGRSGIASLYRLKNEKYGMPADEVLLNERFIKEAIHELGHTFGLVHCHNPLCVMRTSTYVEDIDQKGGRLCHHCRSKL